MNIRSKIYGRTPLEGEQVLLSKRPKGAKQDDLLSVSTPREARRASNHRVGDRHRLLQERVRLSWGGHDYEVDLINLSAGGAMVKGALEPHLWDPVILHLGPNGTVDCAVCWRRGDRLGLQFTDETRLECPADEVAAVLLDVIARNFPDTESELSAEPVVSTEPAAEPEGRAAPRHPLIWSGVLHHDYQSTDVRIRNISDTGAMIECPSPVRVGAEPLIEFSDAVSISTTVEWVVGNQVGLRFHTPFDIGLLARVRPAVAEGWERPAYLEKGAGAADWDRHWRQMDLDELRADLEGFLKR